METFLRRNFKVEGNIASIYKPDDTAQVKLIEGIEVQLWHKAPLEKIFLASGLTNNEGDFSIEFEVNSPVNYIVDGKISDVFLEAYYRNTKLEASQTADLLEGLVAYWMLDELSGTSAVDATGNGHTGSLSGTVPPVWATGKINNGLQFNGGASGVTESFLSVPSSPDFDFGTGDFTFSFWMLANNSSGAYCPVDSGFYNPESFLIQFNKTGAVNIMIGGTLEYTCSHTILSGSWYHIVARRVSGILELFINTTSMGVATVTGDISSPSDLVFGSYRWGIQGLEGLMDEIGVWKGRGLTNEEIETLYNDGDGLQYPFN